MSEFQDWDVQCYRDFASTAQLDTPWREFLDGISSSTNHHDLDYLCSQIRQWNVPHIFVVVRHRGLIKAVAPFCVRNDAVPVRLSLVSLGSVSMQRLRLMGDDFSMANDVSAGDIYKRVFDALAQSNEFNLIDLQDIPLEGELARHLDQSILGETKWRLLSKTEPQTCHTIDFLDSFDQYVASLKKRDRTNFRRRRKNLSAHFSDDIQLVCVSSPDQVPTFLETLDEIYSHTWQSKVYGAEKRNTPSVRDHYKLLAERGWLRSYLLFGKDRALAFQLGIQNGSNYSFVETGYDANLSKLGPGTVLEFLVLEDLLTRMKPATGEFGFGDADYKRRLASSSHLEWEHVYLARGLALKPQTVVFANHTLTKIENATRWAVQQVGMDASIRRWLKRREQSDP